jgi:hypothetical protein
LRTILIVEDYQIEGRRALFFLAINPKTRYKRPMSHNLYLPGCPYVIAQTTTKFTWKWYNKPVIESLPAYKVEYLDHHRPQPLTSKDARNPYMVKAYQAEMQEHDAGYEKLRYWVLANPNVLWRST